MDTKRQKMTQLELAFPTEVRGEAPRSVGEGTEVPTASHATERPASNAQPTEPPCTDPYARWCDRESP